MAAVVALLEGRGGLAADGGGRAGREECVGGADEAEEGGDFRPGGGG